MTDPKSNVTGDVTRLLVDYANGNKASLNDVIPIVYQELKTIARNRLNRSGVHGHVQTTVLVHEAFEKLTVGQTQDFQSRRHFFAIASRAMRQIVVDTYRGQMAAKRGGQHEHLELGTSDLLDLENPERVLLFDEAMQSLMTQSEGLAEVVDLSCFGGLSNQEIADLTGTNVRTIQRQLVRAKAWLDQMIDNAHD